MSFWKKILGSKAPPSVAPAPSAPPPVPRRVQKKLPEMIPPKEDSPYYDVVCPFCMEKYPVWELEFRSSSIAEPEGDEGYPLTVDENYKRFWQKMKQPRREVEKRFVLNVNDTQNVETVQVWGSNEWVPASNVSRKAIRCVKDKYGNFSTQRLCPKCHNDLPPEIGRYPNYIISMMGNTTCGKTVYVSRLILSLLNDEFMPGQIYVTVHSEPQHRLKCELEKMFLQTNDIVREEKKEPEVSPLAGGTPIKYMEPTIMDFARGNEHVLVTLFDFPGEAITRLRDDDLVFFHNLMQRTNENANGWIFLLDSTTLSPIRNCIQERRDFDYISGIDVNDPDKNAEPSEVLRMFHDFARPGDYIKQPVALVFSKSDMIALYIQQLQDMGYKINSNSPFLRESPSNNSDMIDLDDLLDCDESIQAFLRYPNGSDRVLNAASAFFDSYAWFAASATGTPVREGVLERVAPAKRVLEPLKWLLWRMGAYTGQYTQDRDIWGMGDPWPPQG